MFGVTTFAQSTFAGLGIVDYVDSVSETISLTDIQTSSAQFVGTQANTQTLTDTTDVLAGFVGSLTETQTLTDTTNVLSVTALLLSVTGKSCTAVSTLLNV